MGRKIFAEMAEQVSCRIFIVEHDEAASRQLRRLFDKGEYNTSIFASGDAFEDALRELPVGIVFVSLNLPDRHSHEVLHLLQKRRPAMPVVAMGIEPKVSGIVEAMRSGVVDFLEKPIEESLLGAALARAAERLQLSGVTDIDSRLTSRQYEVFRLLVSGMKNKDIGAALGISERTVEIHRARIMKQLQADSFASLVRLATKAGIEPE